jgi:hypothetical protein
MEKLSDGVHECSTCEIYPCTEQDFIQSDVCKTCVGHCCRDALITVLPCEEKMFHDLRRMKGLCKYYNKGERTCYVQNIKPIVCRIATCRIIEQTKPFKLRINL